MISRKAALAGAIASLVLIQSGVSLAEMRDPVFATSSTCDTARTPAMERLEDIVAAVRTGEGSAVSAALDRNWSPQASEARAELEPVLLRWASLNRNLSAVEVCAQSGNRASAFYRNELTGLIDHIRLTVEDGGAGQITQGFARPGYRTDADPAARRPDRVRVARLDDFVDQLVARDLFSGVIIVARDGVPIYQRAVGRRNDAGDPIRIDDAFEMASSTKMFTATIIFQMIEQGRLSLDMTLAEAAPSLVATDEDLRATGDLVRHIQIRHLLSHTSGIVDGPPPYGEPGHYQYANTNFWILGKIIEEQSGMRYEDYLRQYLLGPLGMANTSRYEMSRPSDALVTGYMSGVANGAETFTANPLLQTIAGGAQGGYYSSAPDMLRFAAALRSGRLVSQQSLDEMRSVHPEIGANIYGFGMLRWRGRGIWGHAGDLPGADVDIEFYGDTPYTAIVMSNRDNGCDPLIAKVRALFYPEGGSGPPIL
ncbi:MAG: serine hydrolase domain-containing protein [Hyphomonadaceae bacterium]